MQQFTIPQFIDVEDKIIGPITTRQFIIMLSSCVIIAICYKIFDFELFAVAGLLIFAMAGTFAFLKINGRPFHYFILNFIETLKRPGIRVWRNLAPQTAEAGDDGAIKAISMNRPIANSGRNFSRSRLAQLSLIVDTLGAYREENEGSNLINGIN
ncbi:MAG: PrgI family protein [Patescibacteria group bacterium]|jgi:hypothetical protein